MRKVVFSLTVIGLHCRKWFTALLSQFTPAGPDLRQVQIYTSSRFTPESWPLPPIAPGCPLPGGIYTFTTETALTIVKCFCLRSGAATFSQALCKALGNRLVGRVWLRCRKWVQHTNTAPSPLQTLTPHCTLYLVNRPMTRVEGQPLAAAPVTIQLVWLEVKPKVLKCF